MVYFGEKKMIKIKFRWEIILVKRDGEKVIKCRGLIRKQSIPFKPMFGNRVDLQISYSNAWSPQKSQSYKMKLQFYVWSRHGNKYALNRS